MRSKCARALEIVGDDVDELVEFPIPLRELFIGSSQMLVLLLQFGFQCVAWT